MKENLYYYQYISLLYCIYSFFENFSCEADTSWICSTFCSDAFLCENTPLRELSKVYLNLTFIIHICDMGDEVNNIVKLSEKINLFRDATKRLNERNQIIIFAINSLNQYSNEYFQTEYSKNRLDLIKKWNKVRMEGNRLLLIGICAQFIFYFTLLITLLSFFFLPSELRLQFFTLINSNVTIPFFLVFPLIFYLIMEHFSKVDYDDIAIFDPHFTYYLEKYQNNKLHS